VRLAWGDAAVEITAVDEDGRPVAVVVLHDGELHAGPSPEDSEDDEDVAEDESEDAPAKPLGPATIRGLPAGPVDLVVLPRDAGLLAKALRLVLRPGETRRRAVVLTRR
jgi:hypothetical protein